MSNQLKSSSIVSYGQFMRCGYSIHIDMDTLDDMFHSYFDRFGQAYKNKTNFYSLLATAIGLLPKDFQFGQNVIFFRKSIKVDCLLQLTSDSVPSIITRMQNFLVLCNKWQRVMTRFLRLKGLFFFHPEQIFHTIGIKKITTIYTFFNFTDQQFREQIFREHENALRAIEVDETSTALVSPVTSTSNIVESVNSALTNNSSLRNSPAKTSNSLSSTRKTDEELETLSGPSRKKRKYRKSEKRTDPKIRFDGKDHTPDKENRTDATRCKLEGCTFKSHTFCTKCKVHLCLEPGRNCYKKYHYTDSHE